MNGNTEARCGGRAGLASLYFLFFLASSGFFQKNTGLPGVIAYAAVLAVGGYAWWRFRHSLKAWIDKRYALWASLFLVGLVTVFAVGYPIEDSQGVGRSSDRDQGLNAAATLLLKGEYPYYPPREDAGPLSVFPGAILLAIPFVALFGNSAYQNFFWLAVLLWIALRSRGRRSEALLLLVCAFALSPSLQYEFVSGGDMLSNGIYIALALGLFLRSWSQSDSDPALRIAAAVFLGLALSSRPNLLLLIPLAGGALWRRVGFTNAAGVCALAVAAFAAVSLPFILKNPDGFTPFSAGNKLALIDSELPWGSMSLHLVSAAVSITGGLWLILARKPAEDPAVFGLAAWVTAVPMIGAVALYSVIRGVPDFGFMHPRYGLMYLFFALWAWGFPSRDSFRSPTVDPRKP
jgi:hypothetical protein